MKRLRRIINRRFGARRHTALLVAIIALFAVRPLIGEGVGDAPALFGIAFLILMFVALYNVNFDEAPAERKSRRAKNRRLAIGWILGILAIVERLAMFAERGKNHSLELVATVSWMLFFAFIIWSQLRSVLRQRNVTGETISMSISTYLLMGLTWALFYSVIYQHQPGAFALSGAAIPDKSGDPQAIFPILLYFSLTTLSTIGFGDMTPMTMQARYTAVAEGITGQFYLAILVARLVGMQMSQAADRREDSTRHDSSATKAARED